MAVGLGDIPAQFRRHSFANSRFVHIHWGKEAFRNLLKSGFVFSVHFVVLCVLLCCDSFYCFVNASYECTESAIVNF